MEQGRVTEAADAYQKMIDLKPFYQSYTRAAHLRWLRGDLGGAIEMMHAAVKSASPRDREVRRMGLFAARAVRAAAGSPGRGRSAWPTRRCSTCPTTRRRCSRRGRIQLAQNKNADAAATLERAARLNPLPEYQWTLADALRLAEPDRRSGCAREAAGPSRRAADPRTLALYLSTRREDGAKASISPDVSSKIEATSSRSTRWHGRWLRPGRCAKPRRSWTGRSPKEPRTAACSFTRRSSPRPTAGPQTPRAGRARRMRSASRCFPPSSGCSGRESCHHPKHEVMR